jgi:hypothetical protein
VKIENPSGSKRIPGYNEKCDKRVHSAKIKAKTTKERIYCVKNL